MIMTLHGLHYSVVLMTDVMQIDVHVFLYCDFKVKIH